ncbi:TonB-dependent receptor plug domain-containing protein [Rhodopila sp.]|uniref:TonB-dependent receptor plug domain-containing protein n=1 Tax=Rhodopila sp. TaxID=2480087 RepID=UPI002B96A099|nr:TonB-dependent receptor [Rhodopila sp.]HVZ10514.1 TonB-dependent receptor [Rhodopila sp.]
MLVDAAQAAEDDVVVPLPEQVVTATRVPSLPVDIPAGVSVITRADIEAKGYNSLAEALSDLPGVHVSPSGGLGGQASVFIRGTNSNHVLVLRDGMPINDASDPSGAFNFGLDTLSDIERIEVIRGPMASVYGSGAIGGVINLISRRGSEQGAHWFGDLSGGYPALIRGTVGATGIEGPVDYALTLSSQSQTGYDSVPQRWTNIYTGTPLGFRDRIATLNLGYTPVEGTRLSLFLRGQVAYFGFNNLGSPTFDDSNSTGQNESFEGRIGATTKLFGGALESGAFIGQLQSNRKYLEALVPQDPNQVQSDSRYHSYQTDAQWNNTLHLDDLINVPVLSASALTFGYEYTGVTAKVRVNQSYANYPFNQSMSAYQATNAIYAGLQTTLAQRLAFTGQFRQDWINQDSAATWRLGGVFDAHEIHTHFKFAYGTAFRAPSLYDQYGIDSYGYVGNPALKPEYSQGWETGFTTDLPAFGRPDFLSLYGTYFAQTVRNLIVGVYSPVYTSVNVGSAFVHGVEAEFRLRPTSWVELHAAYTLTNTHAYDQPAGQGTNLLRRPQNQLSVDMRVQPLPKLQIIPTLIYTGSAQDYLYDNQGNGIGYGVGQHGLVGNLAINYAFMPQLEFYVNVWNIFNSRFEPVNGYQMPGPVALAGVRVKL